MKKKIIILCAILSVLLLLLPSCGMSANGSVKSLTRPYIGEYECTEGKLGETDLLEKYDYIKITLVDAKKFEINFKPVNGENHSFEGNYTVDEKTREMNGEIGIFGYKFKEKIKIENGEFTIFKTVMNKPLILKFKMK